MYHKKPYADDVSLKDWIDGHVEGKPAQSNSNISSIPSELAENVIRRRASRKNAKNTAEMVKKTIEKVCSEVAADAVKNGKKEVNVGFMVEEDKGATQMSNLITKLQDEASQLKEKVIKLDDKLINPVGIKSKYQLDLMRIQRNAMMAYINTLTARIDDLELQSDVQN